jgi:hypothetical protein
VRSEDTTRRRLAFVLVVVVGLALWPGRAWADAPERTLFESEDGVVPAGACPFPVFIHVVAINEYRIEFSDDAGNLIRTIIQGRAVLEFTNKDTGASVIRNVSGPATITEVDQIAVKTGPWLFIFFPGDLGTGSPGMMFINYGRVVEYRGEPHSIISQTGVQENLCETLGGDKSEAEASESQVQQQGPPDAPEGVEALPSDDWCRARTDRAVKLRFL